MFIRYRNFFLVLSGVIALLFVAVPLILSCSATPVTTAPVVNNVDNSPCCHICEATPPVCVCPPVVTVDASVPHPVVPDAMVPLPGPADAAPPHPIVVDASPPPVHRPDASVPPTTDTSCPLGTNGTSYDVGVGMAYATPALVPFETLKPGDRVRIYQNGSPYRTKILVSTSGTATNPIRICGIPGADGTLPVINGDNAVTRSQSQFPYVPTQDRGVVILTIPVGKPYGYKPSNVVIQNLEIRGGNPGGHFTGATGDARTYTGNPAALWVERGEHITIHGVTLTDSAYGLFVSSTASATDFSQLSRDILVENCYIYGDGVAGNDHRHNSYTEAIGVVFRYNHFGPLRDGALGSNLKDRSGGLVLSYNWFEQGAHNIDIVDPEDASGAILADPSYRTTYIYGNVFIAKGAAGAGYIAHLGGDLGLPANVRPEVYFYNNTVIAESQDTEHYFTTIFQIETNGTTVFASNNIFYKAGTTNLTLTQQLGHLVLSGKSWINAGYTLSHYAGAPDAVTGVDTLITGTNPGFTNYSTNDFKPVIGSPAIVSAPDPVVPSTYNVTQQYVKHQNYMTRSTRASLGALE